MSDGELINDEEVLTEERIEKDLLVSVTQTNWKLWIVIGILVAMIAFGVYAYSIQLKNGLIETDMDDEISWGAYITTFVFFIGISHVGALMSAILRLTNSNWRAPLTRIAEVITAASLFVGGAFVLIDMGRPERMLNVIFFGRMESPLFWDLLAYTSYIIGSLLFLYIPMIPDIAILRDKHPSFPNWRKKLYKFMALGWTGTLKQKLKLEKAMFAMTVVILPLAISVHTVVSWIFGMTTKPGWNSTIFAPYFVAGALFSGVATVLIVMFFIRKIYSLEKYITPRHFKNLSLLLLALTIIYMYFTLSEFLTVAYKNLEHEVPLLAAMFSGDYALIFWTCIIVGMVIPAFILAIPKTRTIIGIVIASTMINIGMWLKRYVIIVPAMDNPLMPYDWSGYFPSWVEIALVGAGFAAFVLFIVIFAKLFPIVAIWEVKEEMREKHN